MEAALIAELIRKIPELEDNIYPTNAPEESKKPYLVYANLDGDPDKTLGGFGDGGSYDYMFSCMAKRYEDAKTLTDKVTDFLMSLPKHRISTVTPDRALAPYSRAKEIYESDKSDEESVFVQDIVINKIAKTWEPELKVNRGIIDFTIYI
jgi:hypothetical protein